MRGLAIFILLLSVMGAILGTTFNMESYLLELSKIPEAPILPDVSDLIADSTIPSYDDFEVDWERDKDDSLWSSITSYWVSGVSKVYYYFVAVMNIIGNYIMVLILYVWYFVRVLFWLVQVIYVFLNSVYSGVSVSGGLGGGSGGFGGGGGGAR